MEAAEAVEMEEEAVVEEAEEDKEVRENLTL